MPPDPRSSRIWWVRPPDPVPPRPFSCRRFRPSAGEDPGETAEEPESDLLPSPERRGDGRWIRARSVVRVCGVAVLVLAIIAVHRFFDRTPRARSVENSSTSPSGTDYELAPRIFAYEVRHSRVDDLSEDPDEIGVSAWEGRVDDIIWVQASLDPPAYCYLIAFDPDGRFRLADPPEATVSPSRCSEFRYNTRRNSSRGASRPRGAGLQAWLLVAARDPLPPFANWSAARLLPWRSVQAEGVWQFDGRSIERLRPGRRRVLQRTFDSPHPFARLCEFLRGIPDIDAIAAIAYPVRPEKD
ncbi:MAG: hypothetical protein ACLQGP_40400 [Isosphaeraceae bacterium]